MCSFHATTRRISSLARAGLVFKDQQSPKTDGRASLILETMSCISSSLVKHLDHHELLELHRATTNSLQAVVKQCRSPSAFVDEFYNLAVKFTNTELPKVLYALPDHMGCIDSVVDSFSRLQSIWQLQCVKPSTSSNLQSSFCSNRLVCVFLF